MNIEKIYNKIQTNKNEDVFDYLDIPNYNNGWFEHDYYQDKLKELVYGNYFISDLDGTFYRGFLIEYAITSFLNFVREKNILTLNIKTYTRFLEDVASFYKIKQSAHNKQITYNLYVECGMYILLKYANLVKWENFILYLKEKLFLEVRVNPFKFSINKMIEQINNGNIFLFVSGASHFIFDIYLDLLKEYIDKTYGRGYTHKIFGFSSFTDPDDKIINLFSKEHKYNFIKELKKQKNIKIVGGMGDTFSDFGISEHIEKGDFFFVNPDLNVIENYQNIKNKKTNYHFINERKNLIFEFNINKINLLDLL